MKERHRKTARVAEIYSELYVEDRLKESISRVEALRSGVGCRCKNCLFEAVDEVNSWVDMIAGDNLRIAEEHHYRVESTSKGLKILFYGEEGDDSETIARKRLREAGWNIGY